ncbi:hypothetical protein UlMin_033504 [Ulmus minor]
MEICLARTVAASSLIRKSTPENSPFLAGHSGDRKVRQASSSSSSSPDKSKKMEKKLVDRLSSVIDAVNDRKLPLKLRGQRNAFENLPGKGKPLNLDTNPHADPAEDTLYRILSKNGCALEWWRLALKKAWENRNGDESKWVESPEALRLQLRDINNNVFQYNLIIPFGWQMFWLKWEKEMDRLEEECWCCIRLGKGKSFFFF